jgi:hypothetical protein
MEIGLALLAALDIHFATAEKCHGLGVPSFESESHSLTQLCAKPLIGTTDNLAAELTIELQGILIIGQCPNEKGRIAVIGEILTRRSKKLLAEAEALKFRCYIKFEDFAPVGHGGHAIASVARIAADRLVEIEDNETRPAHDRGVPPARSPARDHLLELASGDDAAIGLSPGGIMHLGYAFGIPFACIPDSDECLDHGRMLGPLRSHLQELLPVISPR